MRIKTTFPAETSSAAYSRRHLLRGFPLHLSSRSFLLSDITGSCVGGEEKTPARDRSLLNVEGKNKEHVVVWGKCGAVVLSWEGFGGYNERNPASMLTGETYRCTVWGKRPAYQICGSEAYLKFNKHKWDDAAQLIVFHADLSHSTWSMSLARVLHIWLIQSNSIVNDAVSCLESRWKAEVHVQDSPQIAQF